MKCRFSQSRCKCLADLLNLLIVKESKVVSSQRVVGECVVQPRTSDYIVHNFDLISQMYIKKN